MNLLPKTLSQRLPCGLSPLVRFERSPLMGRDPSLMRREPSPLLPAHG